MRYYQIDILNNDGSVNTRYSTLNNDGSINTQALKIEFDLVQAAYHLPFSTTIIQIHGVALSDLAQSNDLFGKKVNLYLGMSKGLPLANPKQQGLIFTGYVFQSYGNWQGNQISLTLIISQAPPTDSISTFNPQGYIFHWVKGEKIASAINRTLSLVYPNTTLNISINDNLVFTENVNAYYSTIQQFAAYINDITRDILGGNYEGVYILQTPSGINVYDSSNNTTPKQIEYTDIIGNATWINLGVCQIKTVMRGDLSVGDFITLPRSSNTINTPQTYSNYRTDLSFNGLLRISQLRHVGNSRSLDGNSWCTIIDATINNG